MRPAHFYSGGNMNDDLMDLARRAVATGRMTAPDYAKLCGEFGALYYRDDDGAKWIDCAPEESNRYEWLPDLSDPATLGCLLALVREAWGRPNIYVVPWAKTHEEAGGAVWRVSDLVYLGPFDIHGLGLTNGTDHFDGPTEAEALVAALEAAP